MTSLASLIREPIDPAAMLRAVSSPANGAVLLFLGAVRQVNDGRNVTGIDYAAYEAMAQRELEAIVSEASTRFATEYVAVQRVPIWKREHYTDGTREWVDPTGRATAGTPA